MSEPQNFLVNRVSAPSWIESVNDSAVEEAAYRTTGEQLKWGFDIPWMYRALASPRTYEPLLRAPRHGDDMGYGPVAYWSALLHLLIYTLGWVRPDRGMRWWHESGKPLTDENLKFISEIWDADGQLDWFIAWLRTTKHIVNPQLVEEATGYMIGGDTEQSLLFDFWADERLAEAEASRIPAPGNRYGVDLMHLSAHIDGPLRPVGGKAVLLRTGASQYHAVLLLDSMVGWYRALMREGEKLPKLPGRSWHVDVVVKPTGWLGTYRRSAVTGLWFSGRHHVHVKGV